MEAVIQSRFRCFMVSRGETELTLRRAKDVVRRDRLACDYMEFVFEGMKAALHAGLTAKRPDGSMVIMDQDGFTNFLKTFTT